MTDKVIKSKSFSEFKLTEKVINTPKSISEKLKFSFTDKVSSIL